MSHYVSDFQGEVKLRIMHERKCKQLKLFDEKGADTHKAEATRTLLQSISAKIRIAIDVVDKISVRIDKLRDEELWPQINELIHGYVILLFYGSMYHPKYCIYNFQGHMRTWSIQTILYL